VEEPKRTLPRTFRKDRTTESGEYPSETGGLIYALSPNQAGHQKKSEQTRLKRRRLSDVTKQREEYSNPKRTQEERTAKKDRTQTTKWANSIERREESNRTSGRVTTRWGGQGTKRSEREDEPTKERGEFAERTSPWLIPGFGGKGKSLRKLFPPLQTRSGIWTTSSQSKPWEAVKKAHLIEEKVGREKSTKVPWPQKKKEKTTPSLKKRNERKNPYKIKKKVDRCLSKKRPAVWKAAAANRRPPKPPLDKRKYGSGEKSVEVCSV